MSNPPESSRAESGGRLPALLTAVLSGGLIAGTLDIVSACLINSLPPRVILESIASGLLGAASFHDGLRAELAGLALQWAMSLLIAGIYAVAASRWAALRRRAIVGGIAYGVLIFLVMNGVVVPLSAAPFHPSLQPLKVVENLLAMVLFGLIVAAATQFARVGRAARRATPGG